MMASKLGKNYETAKNKVMSRGSSVDKLKVELRNMFKDRLKSVRAKLMDSHRNLSDADIFIESYNELKNHLLSDLENHNLYQEDELLNVLNDIQKELSENEAENYLKELDKETDNIVENLFLCQICNKILTPKEITICMYCNHEHFG